MWYRRPLHGSVHCFFSPSASFIKDTGYHCSQHPGEQDKAVGVERFRGYRDAVQDFGLANLAQNVVTASFTVNSGYEKTKELLEKCGELDGILCATDSMAAGAVQYLREQEIEVPEQILVAGQGDSELVKVMVPPLVTVHYSYEKSGKLAVQMLLELLGKSEAALKEVKLGYALVDYD